VAVVLLALLPGALPGTVSGLLLALVLPGYAASGVLKQRARLDSLPDLLECGALSLALSPLALRLAGLVLPFDRVRVVGVLALLTSGLLLLGLLTSRSAAAPQRRKAPIAFLAILVATLVLLAPTLSIGPVPDGGETRTKGWDLHNHLAIAESIATRGLPPQNPFLQSDAPFYYHALFHVLLAAVLVVAGPSAYPHLMISVFVLLLAALFLGVFHRLALLVTGDGRAALFALPFVSLAGGFDLIPMIGRAVLRSDALGSPVPYVLAHWNVDGWVGNQGMLVPSLFATFYWSPHAVAAMVVFMLALLLLRTPHAGAGDTFLAAACLASLVGYNGYVALCGAAVLALLGVLDLSRFLAARFRVHRDLLLRSLLSAGFAVVLGFPMLSLYLGERGDVGGFRWASPGLLLPLQIVLEFGPALALGLAGLFMVRRRDGDLSGWIVAVLMGAVSLPLVCFVASTGENNDLAMRTSMFLWVGLALFGGYALSRVFPGAAPGSTGLLEAPAGGRAGRLAATSVMVLGSLSVIWFATGAAAGKPILPADEVAAGRWVRSGIPPGLLVQASPLRENPELVYLSGHPAVLSDTWAARLFYATPQDFSRRMASLREAFSAQDPDITCPALRALGVAAVVVGPPEERDFPLLARPDPWPCLREVYQQGSYRVYRVSESDEPDGAREDAG
jgi:hypothetical protein